MAQPAEHLLHQQEHGADPNIDQLVAFLYIAATVVACVYQLVPPVILLKCGVKVAVVAVVVAAASDHTEAKVERTDGLPVPQAELILYCAPVCANVAALVVAYVVVLLASLVECVVAAAPADIGAYVAEKVAYGAATPAIHGAGQAVLKILQAQLNTSTIHGDY